jgi:hypothetical protein
MDENIQTNELTFQKIFVLIKKSFVRIVVYVLIAAVLGAGITTIVLFADNGLTEYKTIIDYNYLGVEDGNDPLDNMLDTSKLKSTVLVAEALGNMSFVSDDDLSSYTQIIADSLSVEGYVSSSILEELSNDETLSYFPTRYTITLVENDALNFEDAQYTAFLNQLIDCYIEYFKETYNYGTILSLSIADDALNSTYDYIDLYMEYKTAINGLISELETLKDNVPERYNVISSNIDSLYNELSTIESYILSNNVKKSSTMSIFDNLTSKKTEYSNMALQYGERADDLYNNIISNYSYATSITSVDGVLTVTTADTDSYDDLITLYNSYRATEFYYEYQASEVERELLILGTEECTDVQRIELETKFETFEANAELVLENANLELEAYSDENVTDNGVKVAMTATAQQNISYQLIIIVTIVCVFVAFLVAIGETSIRQKKTIKK